MSIQFHIGQPLVTNLLWLTSGIVKSTYGVAMFTWSSILRNPHVTRGPQGSVWGDTFTAD